MNRIKKFEPLFGEWKVESFIGAGSYGRVYKVYRGEGEQREYAAVKFLSIPADDTEIETLKDEGLDHEGIASYYATVAKDFTNEALLMSQMKECPNIVSCENSIAERKPDGIGYNIFILMELLESLPSKTRNRSLERPEVLKLGIDICNALDYCAKQGIIHRDIKPDNIFVDAKGNYKLGDFGIARRLEKTMAFMSKKGTYNYMAPEVYRGEPYGANCDIYSLGIVLYRMMNKNRLPFMPPAPASIMPDDQERAMVRRMKGEPVPPPCDADAAFSRIILKACAFNPAHRYQTAKDMWRDLFNLNYAYNRQAAAAKAGTSASPQPKRPAFDPDATVAVKPARLGIPAADNGGDQYGAAAAGIIGGAAAGAYGSSGNYGKANTAPSGSGNFGAPGAYGNSENYSKANAAPSGSGNLGAPAAYGNSGNYGKANTAPSGSGNFNKAAKPAKTEAKAEKKKAPAKADQHAEKPKKTKEPKPEKPKKEGGNKKLFWILGIAATLLLCVGTVVALKFAGVFDKKNKNSRVAEATDSIATAQPDIVETPTEEPPEIPTEEPVVNAEYTYHLSMGASPVNWSPTGWEMSNESTLMSYLEAPLVDISIAADGVNFDWVFEMATSLTDVTATYADRERWLDRDANGELPTENYIYKITLNPDAKWADGTPITAYDYVYSMQQMLDCNLKNYRSNSYFDGDTAIKNAKAYYNNDLVGQPIYDDAYGYSDSYDFYLNLAAPCAFFGANSAMDYYEAGYVSYFLDANGNDLFSKWYQTDDNGNAIYVYVTDEVVADLTTISQNFGDGNPEAWKEWCFVIAGTHQETPWEDVGLIAEGDYTLYYINENPVSEFYMKSNLTSNWLVYKDLYEAGKYTTDDGIPRNNYGTSPETYMSTGPYKLESFEADRQFVLVRNENWYGWNDGKHVGQYQTTRIVYDIIPEHATALMAFEKGELDEVYLTADDLVNYKMSAYLLKTDETYTGRYIFATDLGKLIELEEEANDGKNKKVLWYDDFRKAISLSIDRTQFCADCTNGFKPAYFLLNNLYYCDIEHNSESQYRNTREGREAILRLYGITGYSDDVAAYNSITGYDVETARALFQAVYEQAIADGNYTDGQEIHIRCEASAAALIAEDIRQQEYLTDYVAAATVGTGFEGKISFEFLGNIDKRYEHVALGKIEMIRGAWGGAAFYPYSTIRVYCEPDYMGGMQKIHESCGWDPTEETMTLIIDGQQITKTLQNWAKSMNPGGEYAADRYADVKLQILSNLETAILASYQCIPYGTYTDCSLFSKKINYATTTYNIMYGFGGIRLMTYNYSDEEWAAFVRDQDGHIDYK